LALHSAPFCADRHLWRLK